MIGVYGQAKVCPYENQNCNLETEGLTLEPSIEEIMADAPNRSYDELAYYWKLWRDSTGKVYRNDYINYIGYQNAAASANGLSDASEMWLDTYTMDYPPGDDFRADLEALWGQLEPLYQKLHGYVRYKLRQHSDWGQQFGERDPIPAHLSGNMWAQTWENIYSIVAPYPDEPNPLDEVDDQLVAQVIK